MKILITKAPSERSVKLEWQRCTLKKKSQVLLDVSWLPLLEGSWRDTLTFEVGQSLKKDVPIVFKSIAAVKVSVFIY